MPHRENATSAPNTRFEKQQDSRNKEFQSQLDGVVASISTLTDRFNEGETRMTAVEKHHPSPSDSTSTVSRHVNELEVRIEEIQNQDHVPIDAFSSTVSRVEKLEARVTAVETNKPHEEDIKMLNSCISELYIRIKAMEEHPGIQPNAIRIKTSANRDYSDFTSTRKRGRSVFTLRSCILYVH